MKKKENLRTLIFVLAIAGLVVLLVVVMTLLGNRNQSTAQITLPTQSVSEPKQEPASETNFAEVTKDNVGKIIRQTLTRPASYVQTLSERIFDGEKSAVRTVEIRTLGEVSHITVTENGMGKNILSDGEKAYIWFAGDTRNVREVTLPQGVTLDTLSGVPNYETVAELKAESIMEAVYLTKGETAPSLLVSTAENGNTRYYIDLSSGLLKRAEKTDGEALYYSLEQTGLSLPEATDPAQLNAMKLPDGSAPFTSAES